MTKTRNSDGFFPGDAIMLGAAPCNECAAPAVAGTVWVGRHRAPACTDHVGIVGRVLRLQASLP